VKKLIAERIRLHRLSKSLSQQNIADELQITVAAYSKIERGITDVSVSRVYKIADILGIDPIEILVGSSGGIVNDSAIENPFYTQNNLSQQVFLLINEVKILNSKVRSIESALRKIQNGS
jgi:transcriptional regulator with XRE-family HTH domain